MVITGAARQRLTLLGGVERRRAGVELAELLVVGAINRGEQDARLVALRKGDLVSAGAHRGGDGERRERGRGGRDDEIAADRHGVSPSAGGPACPARGVRARFVPAYFETALGGCNMPVMLCRRPSACLEPPHAR